MASLALLCILSFVVDVRFDVREYDFCPGSGLCVCPVADPAGETPKCLSLATYQQFCGAATFSASPVGKVH